MHSNSKLWLYLARFSHCSVTLDEKFSLRRINYNLYAFLSDAIMAVTGLD